jgi:biopolymer transport protein TolR
MSIGISTGRSQTSEINVTPLIDVLLVLLIIFMVITPLAPSGLATLIPQPPKNDVNHPLPPEDTIVVQVLDRGLGQAPAVRINQEDATWDNLQGRLTEVYKTRAEKVMFVRADDSVDFESVARAINIGHASGADQVGLVTAKMDVPKPSVI